MNNCVNWIARGTSAENSEKIVCYNLRSKNDKWGKNLFNDDENQLSQNINRLFQIYNAIQKYSILIIEADIPIQVNVL